MSTKELLSQIIHNQGPETSDYPIIDKICLEYPEMLSTIKKNTLDFLKSKDSIMGHILKKPYGYAGDFHIIDRIYTKDVSTQFPKWDRYSLENSAAKAVRNRKDYFKKILEKYNQQNKPLNILNVASGPARDLYEFLNENPGSKLSFTCVDLDDKAIAYASKLNHEHLSQIEFIHKNILRFDSKDKFDLVWSAGLFDYFNDKTFVGIIKRMKNWLNKDGEIVIGNFNQAHNPSRSYMEIIGEWYLHHRTEKRLEALAAQASFSPTDVKVGREHENVNLFLHLSA